MTFNQVIWVNGKRLRQQTLLTIYNFLDKSRLTFSQKRRRKTTWHVIITTKIEKAFAISWLFFSITYSQMNTSLNTVMCTQNEKETRNRKWEIYFISYCGCFSFHIHKYWINVWSHNDTFASWFNKMSTNDFEIVYYSHISAWVYTCRRTILILKSVIRKSKSNDW